MSQGIKSVLKRIEKKGKALLMSGAPGQAVASEKMRVLPETEKEIRKKRAVFRPAAKNETIMIRGTNASAPDLVCGSCGAVLAVGVSSHNLRMAIACNRCDAVNETIAKQERQKP